jgi:hypothetical protein
MFEAAENGHIEVLNYFSELGVDIKAKDYKNLTALDYGKFIKISKN